MMVQVYFQLLLLLFLIVPLEAFVITMNMLTMHRNVNTPHPLVMIPGDGGCQAFAEFIEPKSDPFPLWVDLRYLITPKTFGDYFKLIYDPLTHTTRDNYLAKITFPGWGHTWSVDNLDSRPHSVTNYYGDVTSAFLNNTFYKQNYTIRGAPFDFRKGPDENGDFFTKLRDLIEETFFNAGNRRVVLLAHSLGSLYTLKFLKEQPEDWKKRHIKAFISVAGPLGGSMKALKIEASGDNFGIYFQSSLWYREVQRSMPSLAFLLPDPRLWGKNESVIFTPDRNYTVHEYEQFFKDVEYETGYQMYLDTKATVDGFIGPTGIDEVYCLHGSNVSTTAGMIYSPANAFHNAFPNQMPTLLYGDGDGTVDMRSLRICSQWDGVKYEVLPDADHLGIIQDKRLINRVVEVAHARPEPPAKSWLAWTLDKFR